MGIQLIVAKHSKYEWEKKTLHLSHEQIISKYSKEKSNINAILAAHDKQLEVREAMLEAFPYAKMVMMDMFQRARHSKMYLPDDFNSILVIGGDNSFTCVSQLVDNIPILGINSDPERSVGHLTRWSLDNKEAAFKLAELLNNNKFKIQQWTRLGCDLDGEKITPATSEYFFGEKQRNYMSRHVIVRNGKEHEQKCSGIIFATGCGSTGWFKSAGGAKIGGYFNDPTSKICAFVSSELYQREGNTDPPPDSLITKDDEVLLYSLNDNDGLVSIDSWQEKPFNRGSFAKIYIDAPLNVMVPSNELV